MAVLLMLAPSMLVLAPALFSTEGSAATVPASPTLWLKNVGNPVLDIGSAGSFDSNAMYTTAVVRAENKYFLYYTGDSGSGSKVGLATSSDGRSFLKYAANPVNVHGANGSVIRDGTDFKMWYIGAYGIHHAISTDGRIWADSPSEPVLANGEPGSWDVSLRTVNVLRDGDVYKMWYSGGNKDDVRIGYATSPDGLHWTRYAGNPVLVQEASWESVRVLSPCVLRVSGEYQMWYSASNGQSARICYANSTDGILWLKSPFNPLLPASTAWESHDNLCPVIYYDGRDYRMWYTGADASNHARIGQAESTGTGPRAPVPLLPEDNIWTNNSSPVLGWSFGAPGNPDAQTAFRVQLDDSLDLASPLADAGRVDSPDRSFSVNETLPDGTYYWRVMAWDESGDGSAWSDIRTIKIDTKSPIIANLSVDEGAAFTNLTAVRLSLNASDPEPGSGLDETRYTTNGVDWTPWMPFRNAFGAELVGSDREWTITVEVRDRVKNTGIRANASILVDTTPPSQTVLGINDGAGFTKKTSVALAITAADPSPGTGPADMAFSNDGTAWTPWEPYKTQRAYDLLAGDGLKTVRAKVRDRAGNAGAPANASIILDTTPPATTLLRTPPVSEATNFSVGWMAVDALSGVRGFLVEYRLNDGPWTLWLNDTNLTQAEFAGQDGASFSFRARAVDRIGNVEPFPANINMTVRVNLPRPVVAILEPAPQKIIKGKSLVSGTAGHPKPQKTVSSVEVSIDGGSWLPATGTLSWTYTLDTTKLKNGMHNITARSYDGVKYSETAVTAFKVSNEPQSPATDPTSMLVIVLVAVVVGGVASVLVLRGRGRKPVPQAPPRPDLPKTQPPY
jgi:hypothetical protein